MPETIRILLVDNASELTSVAAELLEREDDRFDVTTETDPERALDRLESGAFDCLTTDYRMPGMDGIELLRTVRGRWPDLPVILFTGRGSEEIASEAISAGATDYVRKGSGANQYALLANRIGRAVATRRSSERAARLERNRELARDVNRSLVRAERAETAERSVCERLVDAGPYAAAVVGDAETVRTAATATDAEGAGMEWDLEAIRPADGEAVASTTVADDAGTATVVAVRLTQADREYGVLGVRAADPDAVGDLERDLVAELGDDVASALHRIEMRTKLRESESKYRRLVEQNLVGVYILQNGKFEYVNPRLASVFGYTQAEFMSSVTPYDVVIEEDQGKLRENIRRREAGEVSDLRYTLRGERKDGSEIEFEVHGGRIEYRGEPAIMGTLLDVTERRRQERELERSRAEYRELFEAFPDAVYVGTEEDGFVAVNDTAVDRLGYSREELLSMDPTDINPDVDQEDVAEQVEAFSKERVTTFETVHVAKDGTDIPVEITATLITYRGETAILSTTRDITDRVERERELREQNERLEEVASVVSHDLRNPLNVATGRVEQIRRESDSPHAETAAQALDRMSRLIDDLLALTGRNPDDLDTAPVGVGHVADDCWTNVVTGAATLHNEAEHTVVADRSRLAQVFENLFRNSVEHGSTSNRRASRSGDSVEHGSTSSRPEADDSVEHGSTGSRSAADDGEGSRIPRADGEDREFTRAATEGDASAGRGSADGDANAGVTVRVGDLPDGFYVEDDGPGISPSEREDLFEAGYSTRSDGTGLGLAIVRDVVESHDWSVAVTSGTDGGARFEFTGVELVE